ncbi:MAG: hypothetical protein KGL39_08110 [Patescibacteria group bacterium]|nr:hypothetical protein [Patescibacteria group bacterium]
MTEDGDFLQAQTVWNERTAPVQPGRGLKCCSELLSPDLLDYSHFQQLLGDSVDIAPVVLFPNPDCYDHQVNTKEHIAISDVLLGHAKDRAIAPVGQTSIAHQWAS